jgi:hypothetical protein
MIADGDTSTVGGSERKFVRYSPFFFLTVSSFFFNSLGGSGVDTGTGVGHPI